MMPPSSISVDWPAIARIVKLLMEVSPEGPKSSDDVKPSTADPALNSSTVVSTSLENRLSDFEKFDWD